MTFSRRKFIVAASHVIEYSSDCSFTASVLSGCLGSRTRAMTRLPSSAMSSKQAQYSPAENGSLMEYFWPVVIKENLTY